MTPQARGLPNRAEYVMDLEEGTMAYPFPAYDRPDNRAEDERDVGQPGVPRYSTLEEYEAALATANRERERLKAEARKAVEFLESRGDGNATFRAQQLRAALAGSEDA